MKCHVNISGPRLGESHELPISSQSYPTAAFTLSVKIFRGEPRLKRSRSDREQYLFATAYPCRYKIAMDVLCGYLNEKLKHCSISVLTGSSYTASVRCNYEWLVSVVETEMDYHLGRKKCTKKCNEKYMREYVATQLSGFGEKFYDPARNISQSIIGRIYKMEIAGK